MFEKGKLYTVLGVDGINISRSEGVNVTLDNDSLDINLDNIEDEIFNEITSDTDSFIDNGLDLFVSVGQDDNELYAIDVLEIADEDGFAESDFVFDAADNEDEDEEPKDKDPEEDA